jgi:hypothetical protein
MAKSRIEIVVALSQTANWLERTSDYQWGHMGCCNCGFLAQHVTKLSKNEIHSSAMERSGDWSEQLNDYCSTSGYRFDQIITSMVEFGFDTDDLKHLERLSDHKILHCLPLNQRHLRHNVKQDVVLYLRTWAAMIEGSIWNSVENQALFISPAEEKIECSPSMHYSG